MSTCARCGEYLGEDHHCHGWTRTATAWTTDILVGGLVGAAVGVWVVGTLLTELTGQPFEAVGLGFGPICGWAIARSIRKR
jgi:hypothetical protein